MSDKLRRILILAGVSVAGGLIVGFGSFYAVYPKGTYVSPNIENQIQDNNNNVVDDGSSSDDTGRKPPPEINATFAVGSPVWLSSAQKYTLDHSHDIFSEVSPRTYDVKYYKVGTINQYDIIYAWSPSDLVYTGIFAMFVKKDSSSYVLLKNYSKEIFTKHGRIYGDIPKFSSNITMDSKITYNDLDYHQSILVNGVKLTNENIGRSFFPEFDKDRGYDISTNLKLYKNISEGRLYTNTVDKGTGYTVKYYVLELPDSTTRNYQHRTEFMTDGDIPRVTWEDGTTNNDGYRYDGYGTCGNDIGLAIMNNSSLSGYMRVGTTKNGDPVYGFSSSNNPTVKYYYYSYASKTGKEGGQIRRGVISLQTYWQKHGVFVFKDALGRLVLFISLKYGPNIECGKPVVYLYPTKPTQVSVKVGADITKSDPNYGTGWKVLAMPNGSLFNGVKSYPYLFWEGTGDIYPSITKGFVIRRAVLVSTISNQLRQMGLNEKESADFMEFWAPKLPTTPYTRVTWFGKSQMDLLAPLTVSPKPDTVIRIFMDFEGLDKPVNIPPQRLAAPQRKGFTVVEWGGLLRNLPETETEKSTE